MKRVLAVARSKSYFVQFIFNSSGPFCLVCLECCSVYTHSINILPCDLDVLNEDR